MLMLTKCLHDQLQSLRLQLITVKQHAVRMLLMQVSGNLTFEHVEALRTQ